MDQRAQLLSDYRTQVRTYTGSVEALRDKNLSPQEFIERWRHAETDLRACQELYQSFCRDLVSAPIVLVAQHIAVLAAAQISSCDNCSADPDTSFDRILSDVSGHRGRFEFLIPAPVFCPVCLAPVHEKTRVRRDESQRENWERMSY